MKFKNFKFTTFLTNMIVLLLFPIFKLVSSEKPLLAFSDSCMIIAIIMALIGIVFNLYLSGDFDITGYIAGKAFNRNKKDFEAFKHDQENRDFDIYMQDQKEKRKDSFNYPLLCSILMFLISLISALFV